MVRTDRGRTLDSYEIAKRPNTLGIPSSRKKSGKSTEIRNARNSITQSLCHFSLEKRFPRKDIHLGGTAIT
jgi:hypothetical protein